MRVEKTAHLGALGLYAVLSVAVIDHGAPLSAVLGRDTDPFIFIWFLAWWPWAAAHHADLLHTGLLWQPLGVDLFWVTSIPLLAAVAAPVTKLAGPVESYDLLMLAAPALGAWAAYFLCLRVTRALWPALIGGYLFGFSSYEMAQSGSALNLSFTVFLPLLALIIVNRLDDRLGRAGVVALASSVLIGQFLVSVEIFALIFVFGGMLWLLAMLYLPAARGRLRRLLVDGLAAGPVVGVVLSPCLVSMLMRPGYLHLPGLWPYFFTADLLNVFVPTGNTIGGALFAGVTQKFNAGIKVGYGEQDAYIGLPLLAILVLYARENWARPVGRLLCVAFLALLVASLGPHLWVGGVYTPLLLPWSLFVHLPLLSACLPARFALFVSLAVAVIAAQWVAGGRGRLWLGLAACLALLPMPHATQAAPWSDFFRPGRVQAVLGPQARLLILPFAINGPSSFWQAENGFGFRQTGGYLGFTPAAMQRFPAAGALYGNLTPPGFAADFADFCQATGTDDVVAGPGTPARMLDVLRGLGWAHRRVDDVEIFAVPVAAHG
jgi:hypothetical protein